jgi:hypothetical protein
LSVLLLRTWVYWTNLNCKKRHYENDEATSETSATLTPQKDFLPVFITLIEEGLNFETMEFSELNECFAEIKKAVSPLKSIKVARRGDIVINVTTEEQRRILLSLDRLGGRKIRAFSPMNSIKNKGVIYKVPPKFSDEEIHKNTNYQNIESVKRITVSKNGILQPTTAVIFTFMSTPPESVSIMEIEFKVFPYIPAPKLCRRCWKIGHTISTCSTNIPIGMICCKHCSMFHEEIESCPHATKCIRCGANSHEADNKGCPIYIHNKEALKISISQGIPLSVAKHQIGTQYSLITKSNMPTTTAPTNIQHFKGKTPASSNSTNIQNSKSGNLEPITSDPEALQMKQDILQLKEIVGPLQKDVQQLQKTVGPLQEMTQQIPELTRKVECIPRIEAEISGLHQKMDQITLQQNQASKSLENKMLAEMKNLASLFHSKFMAVERSVTSPASSEDLDADMEEDYSHEQTSSDLQNSPARAATPTPQVDTQRKSLRLQQKKDRLHTTKTC